MTVTSDDVAKKGARSPKLDAPPPKKKKPETIDPAKVVLDAVEAFESATKELTGGKIIIKMETENMSYTTAKGVRFTREHPFQLVDEDEASDLVENGGFRRAYPDEVESFYKD